MKQNKPL